MPLMHLINFLIQIDDERWMINGGKSSIRDNEFAFALLNLITQKEILKLYKSELNKFYIFKDVLKLFQYVK